MYSCVASAGQAEDYQAMLRLHEQADSHEEKERIARWIVFYAVLTGGLRIFFMGLSIIYPVSTLMLTGLASLPSPTRRCFHRR